MVAGDAQGSALLLGIDQGTTGTKAMLFDARLRPLASAYRRVGRRQPRPGWVEQDPEELLASVLETAAEVSTEGPIAALGLANQGETVLAWEPGGRPLGPAVVWQCRRSEPIVERLRRQGVEGEVRALSGLPLDAYFSSTKMTWLLEEVEPVAAAARAGRLRLGTTDAWLRERLGGEPATDPTTASRTQLMNLDTLEWDERLLEVFGVPREALPKIRPTASPQLGELRLGEVGAAPLRAGAVDQQAALAGQGCVAPGQVKCTYGTGCFVLGAAGPERPRSGEGLLPTVAWALDGGAEYALDGGVLTAGACVDWLVSLGLAQSPEEADRLAAEAGDTGGVRFLPALAGLGAPWWDAAARGVFAGLTEAAGAAQLCRAVLDGIAHRVADIVEAISAAAAPPAAIRVDGGLTSSAYLMRAQADLLGIPLRKAVDAEATSRGVAALAAVGAGLLDGVRAIPALLDEAAEVAPTSDAAERAAARAAWREFVEGAKRLG